MQLIEKEHRELLIVGHPRSGTRYMSALCQTLGKNIGSEHNMGSDGISTCLYAACENPRWGPDPERYSFSTTIHLVRDPVKVISSVLAVVDEEMQAMMARSVGVDPETPKLERVCAVYLRWHEYITALLHPHYRICVEDAVPSLRNLFFIPSPLPSLPPTNWNCREWYNSGKRAPDITREELGEKLPMKLFAQLFIELAGEYGYDREYYENI